VEAGPSLRTIICDLEQRRIVDILPDREAAVTKWLAEHPSIIARDRGAGFMQAATQVRSMLKGDRPAVPTGDLGFTQHS
jgi:hypothetical protein